MCPVWSSTVTGSDPTEKVSFLVGGDAGRQNRPTQSVSRVVSVYVCVSVSVSARVSCFVKKIIITIHQPQSPTPIAPFPFFSRSRNIIINSCLHFRAAQKDWLRFFPTFLPPLPAFSPAQLSWTHATRQRTYRVCLTTTPTKQTNNSDNNTREWLTVSFSLSLSRSLFLCFCLVCGVIDKGDW